MIKNKPRKRREAANHVTAPPHVGIFYLVGDKLFIDATPLSRAQRYGDNLIHERGHIEYWALLVKSRLVPDDDYGKEPRGRVAYNKEICKYTLLADPCILRKKKVVKAIWSQLQISPKDTETGTDGHYKCYVCLRRSDTHGRPSLSA